MFFVCLWCWCVVKVVHSYLLCRYSHYYFMFQTNIALEDGYELLEWGDLQDCAVIAENETVEVKQGAGQKNNPLIGNKRIDRLQHISIIL